MATLKIDIKKAINPEWLDENGYTIMLPENRVHRLRLSEIIWNNTTGKTNKERSQLFLRVTEGIELRTLQRYRGHNFQFNLTTLGKKAFKDPTLLEKYKKDSFMVEVRENETNLPKYNFRIKLDKAEEFTIKKPETILDVEKVAKIRENEVAQPGAIEIHNPEQIENTARQICMLLASGQVSIYEACNRYNVKYIDFARWYGTNDFIKQMYYEAITMGSFFNMSSQRTEIERGINELLQTKVIPQETIHYTKYRNNANPDGIWVEEKKTIVNRRIDEKGYAMLMQLQRSLVQPNLHVDEYDSMSDEELFEKIQGIEKKLRNTENND